MTPKRLFRIGLGVVVAGVFVYLIARHVNGHALIVALMDIRVPNILGAVAAFFVGYACRIQRWTMMLACDNPKVSWAKCAGPFMASYAVNNVLPFRSGDLLRIFAFTRQINVPAGGVAATLFVERLLDFLMIVAALTAAVVGFGVDVNVFGGVGSGVLVFVTVSVTTLLFFPKMFAVIAQLLGMVAMKVYPRFGEILLPHVEKSVTMIEHMSSGRTMLKLLGWSALAWIAEGCVFWFVALAVPAIGWPKAAWLAMPSGTLATLLPGTPGYIGTFDFFTIKAMTLLHNGSAGSIAYALLVHLILWLPATAIGASYLLGRYAVASNGGETIR